MTLRHDGHEFTDGEGLGLDECLGLGEVRPKPLREQGGVNPRQHILIKISRMNKFHILPPPDLGEVRPKPLSCLTSMLPFPQLSYPCF